MRLLIDNTPREFIDIKTFRANHGLPAAFGVNFFEPKDYSGLGRIDRAGAELNSLRQAVLAAIPAQMTPEGALLFLPELARCFEEQLYAINAAVGLRDAEVGFAVAGFDDVCRALLYALIQARRAGTVPPAFPALYTTWLENTLRISQKRHSYLHTDEVWQVQIVNHVYGRVGLIVRTGQAVYYVRDMALACPAEGFMFGLLSAVAARVMAALNPTGAT